MTDDLTKRLRGLERKKNLTSLPLNKEQLALLLEAADAIDALRAENERLREGLKPFVACYQSWMDSYPDDSRSSTHPVVTFGQMRRARALLQPKEPQP